jgi:hypothetical protein
MHPGCVDRQPHLLRRLRTRNLLQMSEGGDPASPRTRAPKNFDMNRLSVWTRSEGQP